MLTGIDTFDRDFVLVYFMFCWLALSNAILYVCGEFLQPSQQNAMMYDNCIPGGFKAFWKFEINYIYIFYTIILLSSSCFCTWYVKFHEPLQVSTNKWRIVYTEENRSLK